MTEKQFENKIKEYLIKHNILPFNPTEEKSKTAIGFWEKRHADAFTKVGLPDMHIVIGGVSLNIEIKKEGGKPTELQKKNLRFIYNTGGLAMLVYPEDFDKLKEAINSLIKDHIPFFICEDNLVKYGIIERS